MLRRYLERRRAELIELRKRYIEKEALVRETLEAMTGPFPDLKSYAKGYALSQIRCLYLLRNESHWADPVANAWIPASLLADYSW